METALNVGQLEALMCPGVVITSLVAVLWWRRGEVVARTARCSTAALTAVLFKVSFVQLSAGEEVAVVRGTIISNISVDSRYSVINSFTNDRDRFLGF